MAPRKSRGAVAPSPLRKGSATASSTAVSEVGETSAATSKSTPATTPGYDDTSSISVSKGKGKGKRVMESASEASDGEQRSERRELPSFDWTLKALKLRDNMLTILASCSLQEKDHVRTRCCCCRP